MLANEILTVKKIENTPQLRMEANANKIVKEQLERFCTTTFYSTKVTSNPVEFSTSCTQSVTKKNFWKSFIGNSDGTLST
jgi:hypothetical protein